MKHPLVFGLNAKSSVLTYNQFSADPVDRGPFTSYFNKTFIASFSMLNNKPDRNSMHALSLLSLEVGNGYNEIHMMAQHGSVRYRADSSKPKFDKAIATLAKVAMKYHPLRAKNWAKFHLINSITEHETRMGVPSRDVGANVYRHVQGDEEKIKKMLKFADKDIKDHVSSKGFGPDGWLKSRSDEFMNTFGLDSSLGDSTSVYTSMLFQSMLRGIPTRHLMDMSLDYMQAMVPKKYEDIMNMKEDSPSLHNTVLLNVLNPDRKRRLLTSHYRKLCA